MSDISVTMVTLGLAVVAFVSGRVPTGLVAVGASLALLATGVLDLQQAFAGFADPAVVLIASLFVVAEGLDASGLTGWAGQQLIRRGGTKAVILTVLVMLLVAVLSALISVNGAVAALLPVVVVVASRISVAPARLLLPLAFGAHAGSLLTLTGSPVNVIISELAAETGAGAFGFFEFTTVGAVLVVGTVLITVLCGRWLIPERTPAAMPRDLSDHARTLLAAYGTPQPFARVRVRANSPLVGRTPAEARLEEVAPVQLIAVQGSVRRPASETIRPGDWLLVRGATSSIKVLEKEAKLTGLGHNTGSRRTDALIDATYGVAEIVVAPRSSMIGETVFPGMVTDSGDLVVLAVQRAGEAIEAQTIMLESGDVLLVQGRWEALDLNLADPSVLVVDKPDQLRRQAAPLSARSWIALGILVAMVVLLATGVMQAAVTGLLAAAAMVLTRVVTVERAHRSISWTTLLLVGGMIPMSTAITQTGAAALIADGLVGAVGHAGPLVVLLALCVVALVFGQLISNTATALIISPIAVSVAAELQVSPLPFLMAVAVVSAAAFLTPVATPANFMIMGPAGLRFGDYWRLGIVLIALFLSVAVLLVPMLWPF
ncbi:SLC13 family permease [Leifsonia aquatica]|uniref:SLC13 family permease n=1 Tax=Leifsonia aquatica TaxID=144185 RepID=UPI0004691963|nr:SLC13 family permease [Leifsonia aquatica]